MVLKYTLYMAIAPIHFEEIPRSFRGQCGKIKRFSK